LLCITISSVKQHIQQGRVVPLAVTTAKRSPSLPELPTIAESRYPGFDATQWIGVLVPKATPKAIVNKLHKEVIRIITLPDVRGKLLVTGVEVVGNTPEAFAAQICTDADNYGKLAVDVGIRLD